MKDERFEGLDLWGRVLLLKKYFDQGMAITNYLTKVLMVVGIGAAIQKYSLVGIMIVSFCYALGAFLLGYCYIKFRFLDRENEIENRINPFQRQVRESLNIRKVFK